MSRFGRFISTLALTLGVVTTLIYTGGAHAQLLRRAVAQADVKPGEPLPAPAAPITPAPTAVKPAEGEAAAPGEEKPLTIKVIATSGNVQVRLAEGQAWQPVTVGMDLHIGAEIRTGLRSICQFTIDGNHTITLDRLGVIVVLDAIKKDGRVKTDVGMKYGRTQYKVELNAADHDARVHAPSATLAVRGSFVTLEDNDAFGSTAIVDHSQNAIYKQRAPEGQMRVVAMELIRGRIEQSADQAGGSPPTPGQMALRDTINDVGVRLAQASEQERDLIGQYPLFDGANPNGPLPPPGHLQDQAKDVFKAIGGSGDFTPGFLDIFVTFSSGGNDVFFAVIDPAGGRLTTAPGHPSGGTLVVRPGGPSRGQASISASSALLKYDNQIAVGGWSIFAGLLNGAPDQFTNYNIQVQQRETAGSTPFTIASFSGSLDVVEIPIESHGFSVEGPGSPGLASTP